MYIFKCKTMGSTSLLKSEAKVRHTEHYGTTFAYAETEFDLLWFA